MKNTFNKVLAVAVLGVSLAVNAVNAKLDINKTFVGRNPYTFGAAVVGAGAAIAGSVLKYQAKRQRRNGLAVSANKAKIANVLLGVGAAVAAAGTGAVIVKEYKFGKTGSQRGQGTRSSFTQSKTQTAPVAANPAVQTVPTATATANPVDGAPETVASSN